MTCLECGLKQAVADAGTCARCRAPLPSAGRPPGTFTGPDGAELRAHGIGIHVRGPGDAPARLIPWHEIGWFRDGWHAPKSKKPHWELHIVVTDGRVDQVSETRTAAQAPPELVALIWRAAAAHSVPAVLTGGEVHAGLPGDDVGRGNAGLYCDPAGEPGLREWTGTEWSPFLQVDPVASGHLARRPDWPGSGHRCPRKSCTGTRALSRRTSSSRRRRSPGAWLS
jgi:hypothetical protein